MNTSKAVIADLYAAFASGNVSAVLAAMAPDIAWTEAAGFPLRRHLPRPAGGT